MIDYPEYTLSRPPSCPTNQDHLMPPSTLIYNPSPCDSVVADRARTDSLKSVGNLAVRSSGLLTLDGQGLVVVGSAWATVPLEVPMGHRAFLTTQVNQWDA